jgi:hypothetical protein
MATQISSDIATEVDITARAGDSFFLKITLTKADGTAYDFSDYEDAKLLITNNNNDTVRQFNSSGTGVDLPQVASAMVLTEAASGILTVSVAGGNMNISRGNYNYKLFIEDTTPAINEKITVMFGKFKINN